MKKLWLAILFTLALYGVVWVAFLLDYKYGYSRGANDMDQSLLTFAFSTILIVVFFIRSVYQAIRVDESYWLIAVLHTVGVFAVTYYVSQLK